MDRAEATGFGVAVTGHLALLAALTLGFASVTRPLIESDPIEVSFVDEIGLRAAVRQAQIEDPAEAQAPEVGPPEEAAPTPVEAPTPEPTPAPPKAVEPAPAPKPAPKQASKPAPPKPAPPKAAPKASKASGSGQAERARASRLGDDFLKGITETSRGKATTPRAAVSSRDMAGLVQAIRAQVKPCYVVPTGGTDALQIQTVLRLRFRKNGEVAMAPDVVEQNGVTGNNRGYAQQMADAAKRAVLRCAPLKLPANLYEGGWEDIEFVFNPRAMG